MFYCFTLSWCSSTISRAQKFISESVSENFRGSPFLQLHNVLARLDFYKVGPTYKMPVKTSKWDTTSKIFSKIWITLWPGKNHDICHKSFVVILHLKLRHDSACCTAYFVVNNSEICTLFVVEQLPLRMYNWYRRITKSEKTNGNPAIAVL